MNRGKKCSKMDAYIVPRSKNLDQFGHFVDAEMDIKIKWTVLVHPMNVRVEVLEYM